MTGEPIMIEHRTDRASIGTEGQEPVEGCERRAADPSDEFYQHTEEERLFDDAVGR